MQTIKLNTTNPETLELFLSQIKDIESMGLEVQTTTLENVTDPNLEWNGIRWSWEIKSQIPLNSHDNSILASILDPDKAGSLYSNHDKETKTYKFTLEIY